MQPQVPQAAGTADMDLTAVQSMDWFFKKEQFYLLAQFLQQRANLADKDVNPLKDQLTTNTDTTTSNSTDIPADIDDFSAVAAAALAANSSASSTTTSTATTTDSNSTTTTTTTNHHTTVPPSSKLLSPISAAYSSVAAAAAAAAAAGFNSPNSVHNNNNNTKLLNSVAAAITLHQNGGNLLAATTTNTPSPSPPLSTDGCSIAAAAAACGNNSVSPLSAALNGVNGCLNPKLFFNHAQQMMMEAAAAAAAAVQQQQSPLHSPLQGAQHVDDDEMDEDGCSGGATAVDASKLITSLTAEMRLVKRGGEEDADEEEEEEQEQQGEYDDADADENANARKRSKNARDHEDSPEQHKAAVDNAKTNVCGQRTDDTSLNFSSSDSNKTTSCSVNKSNFARKTRATKASSKLDRAAEIGDDCIDNDDDGDDNDADHAAEANRMEIDGGESGESGKIDATIKLNAVGSNHAELIAAKDKEIKALIEEVQRLRTLEQTQLTQIQRLEDHLEVKRQHIIRLEARLDKQQINAALAEAAATATASSAIVTPTTTAAASSTLPVTHVVNDDEDDDDDNEGDEQDDKDGEQAAIVAIADTAAVAKIDLTTTTRAETTATERITDADADAVADAETVADAELAVDRACEKLTTATATTTTTTTATTATNNNGSNTTAAAIEVTEPTVGEIKIKKENHSPLDLDVISQQSAIAAAAAAAAAAACANDPNKFQELLLEGTKALAAAEAFKSAAAGSSATEDALLPSHQHHLSHHAQGPAAPPPPPPPMPSHHHLHQPHLSSDAHPKSSLDASNTSSNNNHELSANANASHALDQRDDHHSGLNGSGKSLLEDNNNTLCGTPNANAPSAAAMAAAAMAAQPHPHLPPGYLHALPFQFQDRGHFRFADDLQLPPGASMAGRLGESLIPKSDPMEAKLQEMLRYNMDKYANQPLDTLHISRRIRELLSVHNIGQRLFAKYILGLSQGTVSELLSKPKPWDKLTEKGRDSYRKMHAWGCDDNAVMLLKSLIPKKDSGLPPYGGREDSMSDDRLAHIFNEASSLIKNSTPGSLQQQLKEAEQRQLQQEQHRRSAHDDSQHSNEDSKSPHPLCTSPFYKSTSQLKQEQEAAAAAAAQQQQHRLRQEQELTPDKMARIYQEFLMRTPREAAFPSLLLSPFFSAAGGMPSGCGLPNMMGADENLRLAYEREMAKLQQQQQQNAAAAAAAGSLPNFPNFSNLMALQQQVLNGAQDLTLTKDPKDAIKINGQRSIEHSSNSMDSQSNSNSNAASMSGGGSSSQNNAKDLPHADSLERHSSAGLSLHSRKLDSSGSHTPVPPPTSSASVSMHGASNSTAPSPLSNSILPPAMTPNDDFAATASPLQRMASITNSLITQPPVPPHHTPPQRPTKAVLPPITQQQFDMFNNLNTEDIVRRVKEALSQYSISQRLFGESVLGLSQGSVSDLLARPKPWHMLTQKGREPFIRMKMFLEDENAVHKLVASQYKIAPEKLMRTGSYSGTPQIPQGLASKMGASLPMQKMMNELKLQEPTQAQHIMQQMQAAAMSAAMQQHQQQAQSQQQHAAAVQAAQAAAAAQAAHHQSMLLTSPGLPPQHAISLPPTGPTGGNTGPGTPGSDKKPMMMPIHSPHQANAMRSMHQHMSPTVYEMAALTQDLDTQVITTKIKEALLANNIGQKIFGEAVLGLSQGSVSELLSKPKPWHMLSIKGREPFIRMQLWLSDANNVERLQVIKNERREASKRRRSTGPNQQDNSSDTSSNDTNDFYTSSPGPGSVGSSVSGAPPNKKQRVLFSEEQKEALRLAFQLDPYPNVGTIEFLANELSLATRTITNWFHNHRMRLKQQVPHNQPGVDNLIPSRENTNSTPFDPVQFRILLQQRLLELHKERMGLSGAPTLPYPPYFAAAALLGRSLAGMPGAAAAAAAAAAAGAGGEPDLHALNQAFREQMSGLDLTMSSLKRERSVDYDDDLDESHLSDNESLDGGDGGGDDKSISGDYKDGTSTPRSIQLSAAASYLMGGLSASMRSSSRRKPAAPQWVNPAGPVPNTDANGMAAAAAAVAAAAAGMAPSAAEQDRIINGVCVMQPSDFSRSEAGDSPAGIDAEAISKRGETDVEQPPSFMEPEVRIKQEKEDCDSDNEVSATASLATAVTSAAAAASSEEKLKVMSEDKLRMVRVQRHSHEDDAAAAAAAATAGGVPTTNASVVTAASAASAWSY
ncbi:homeobox protein cut isoform X3 [Rhagoletis pomonella]|uniref:homeobox protein cut isoform X3 n=1 Tax=Rhagoletis pomonella TaxID=28610 RepID=UPI00177A9606|nr:homeobox protein cut isoform X3 [Rhagoletis pomonella]